LSDIIFIMLLALCGTGIKLSIIPYMKKNNVGPTQGNFLSPKLVYKQLNRQSGLIYSSRIPLKLVKRFHFIVVIIYWYKSKSEYA